MANLPTFISWSAGILFSAAVLIIVLDYWSHWLDGNGGRRWLRMYAKALSYPLAFGVYLFGAAGVFIIAAEVMKLIANGQGLDFMSVAHQGFAYVIGAMLVYIFGGMWVLPSFAKAIERALSGRSAIKR